MVAFWPLMFPASNSFALHQISFQVFSSFDLFKLKFWGCLLQATLLWYLCLSFNNVSFLSIRTFIFFNCPSVFFMLYPLLEDWDKWCYFLKHVTFKSFRLVSHCALSPHVAKTRSVIGCRECSCAACIFTACSNTACSAAHGGVTVVWHGCFRHTVLQARWKQPRRISVTPLIGLCVTSPCAAKMHAALPHALHPVTLCMWQKCTVWHWAHASSDPLPKVTL